MYSSFWMVTGDLSQAEKKITDGKVEQIKKMRANFTQNYNFLPF